jgi:cytoskeleton protein RodZ
MEEGAAQSQTSSPGARLAAAREQSGMTLVEAAERLRLDVATLQALEAGRFHTLGAAVFVRGHLRHYAELLGLPVDEIEAAYAASSAKLAPQPDLRRTTTLPGNSASRGFSLPPRVALIGAIVLVLVALVWWAMRVPPGRRHAANPAGSSPASSLAVTPQPANAVDAGPEPSAEAVAASKSPAATSKDAASKNAASKDTISKDSSAPRNALSAVKEVALAPKQAAAPKAASGQVRMAIRFNQDSWIEVYDARGSTLFHDFGGAGSERRVTGAAPLRVLLGNPDGVSVELNGHPVALRPAAESGRPQRFLLDSAGGMSDVPTPPSQRAPSASSTPP